MTDAVRLEALPEHFRLLVDPDPAKRAGAVRRQRADWAVAAQAYGEQVRLANENWLRHGGSFDYLREPELLRRVQYFGEEGSRAGLQTLNGTVASLRSRPTPFAEACGVLFLRWENEYFDEWATAGSGAPVGIKFVVLRHFRRRGVPPEHRPLLVKLTLAAAAREYRCEDRGYAALAHQIDDEDLRAGLSRITTRPVAHEPALAFYLEALLERPECRCRVNPDPLVPVES